MIGRRVRETRGQATIVLVAGVLLTFSGVAVFAQFGEAFVARGRDQRSADLAATAAATRMSKDFPRLFVPPTLPNGAPNPLHLSAGEYKSRAQKVARASARANHATGELRSISFGFSPTPTSITIKTARRHEVGISVAGDEDHQDVRIKTEAKAALRFSFGSMPQPMPGNASGGGYSGPLAYRQGKPMRPDVAAAFDQMAAAARRAGLSLTVNSGFRSDSEQARLFAQHPDPKWVAPPGTSLHRYGTELDLGPPGAYGWLAANARRFGFIKRYAWEPWHFGFGSNPRDVPAQYERGSFEPQSGSFVGPAGLPSWVPQKYVSMIADAAQRYNVQPLLLASQLRAESDFNPNSVSSSGAQGIAQFMPGTAQSIGLSDPFDPGQAIMAQGKLMGTLIRQFKSIPKALAAYNAGPGAVQRYGGVPPFAETQGYVAKILAMMKGGGVELDDPAFAGINVLPRVVLIK
jgi:hypothetical protein